MQRYELLTQWGIPFWKHAGVLLVAREDADACVNRLLSERCALHGYEAFTLFADRTYQPHLKWSASWSAVSVPTALEISAQLSETPPEVTHFEFVFDSSASNPTSQWAAPPPLS
jgi:hypothetical protein